jgi:hypothetical protein
METSLWLTNANTYCTYISGLYVQVLRIFENPQKHLKLFVYKFQQLVTLPYLDKIILRKACVEKDMAMGLNNYIDKITSEIRRNYFDVHIRRIRGKYLRVCGEFSNIILMCSSEMQKDINLSLSRQNLDKS